MQRSSPSKPDFVFGCYPQENLTKYFSVRYNVHIIINKIIFMNIKNTLPITRARQNFFKITDEVQRARNYYTLTERGVPKAVIMSADEFDSWQETLEVMHEIPDLEKDIRKVERDVKTGAYKNYPTLEQVLAEHGYVLRDKAKNKYEVSNKNRAKGKKRI